MVVIELNKGVKPLRPSDMTDEYWSLINMCWADLPQLRPSIKEVTTIIQHFYRGLPCTVFEYIRYRAETFLGLDPKSLDAIGEEFNWSCNLLDDGILLRSSSFAFSANASWVIDLSSLHVYNGVSGPSSGIRIQNRVLELGYNHHAPKDLAVLQETVDNWRRHVSFYMPLDLPQPIPDLTSGFDLLLILAQVINRPDPKIMLGPVDPTCSLIVVNVRSYYDRIVYCSPAFCQLTGYEEYEVLGRNCRFLQSPDGSVQQGDLRWHTDPEAVAHLKKSLMANKECQTSLANYRKDGTGFINLLTIIPITELVANTPDEVDQVAYHVGFQADLTGQPNDVFQSLRDGSYIFNYSSNALKIPKNDFPST